MEKLFKKHRVVFWYDKGAKMIEEFEGLVLDGVEKIKVENNQFYIKHRILTEKGSKFLLYFDSAEPEYEENWLLDIQLANFVYKSDIESKYMEDVGLEYHFRKLVENHTVFFENKERRAKLKDLLGEGDAEKDVIYKMLGVCFDVDYINLESFIQSYAQAFNNGNNRIELALDRYNLKEIFWKEIEEKFKYRTDKPEIYDFLLTVFKHNFKPTAANSSVGDSKFFIRFWQDSISYQESFKDLSERISKDLNIVQVLDDLSYENVLQDDLYKEIDFAIIHGLSNQIEHESITFSKVQTIIKERENKYWYNDFKECYDALYHASSMINDIRLHANIKFVTIEEGANKYANELYSIDYSYRKFIYNYKKTNYQKVLNQIYLKIQKVYSNDWLLSFTDNWQQTVDKLSAWPINSRLSQTKFFDIHIKPVIDKKQRLFVVISDALRYENAKELWSDIQSKQRYEASLDYMITNLPSYTQLGMASLLPHKQLSILAKDSSVMVDGMSSVGIYGRNKILETNSGVRANAISAEDFMNMNASTEGREYVKAFDLIYIYHNRIDAVGDNKTSESKVFEAVEEELQFLDDVLRQIANMNGNNIIITADHGYIYQNEPIAESDFSDAELQGEIYKENRRFVLGRDLSANNAVLQFKGDELGLNSDLDILITKSINRLRIKGSGSRYVHGGASLQEVTVPILHVSRKRKDTTAQVDIDIIQSSDQITTNVHTVTFIQKELVSEKVLARTIRANLQANDGTVISDNFNYNFDIADGSERERAVTKTFQLSALASGKYKGQRVKLIIEEPIANSSRWKLYAKHGYTLKISFINDFD